MLTSDPEARAPEPLDGSPGRDPEPEPARRHRVARFVGGVGRLMMTSGVVILLLVVYQLWGTGIQTARAQGELADEFAEKQSDPDEGDAADEDPSPEGDRPATTQPEVAETIAPPGLGEVMGRISIPKLSVADRYVVEGVGTDQLKRGAAHYPGTPMPGQAGNASVAGHRTTYGAPFKNVDNLVAGDEIIFETLQGRFRYEVIDVIIVKPGDTWVLDQEWNAEGHPGIDPAEVSDDRLTLTACHPEYSARERIIVSAALVGDPVEKLDGQDEAAEQVLEASEGEVDSNAIDVFATEPALTFPGAWWGLVCMALWGLTRLLAYLGHRNGRWPRWVPYLVGTPVCLLVLYLFFESFSYEGFARTVGLSI